MSGSKVKVLFDASSFPGYEEARGRHLRTIRLFLVSGMLGMALMLFLVWATLEVFFYSGIDAVLLGSSLLALAIVAEAAMFAVVRPLMMRGWKTPIKITEEGVLRSDKLFSFDQICKLTRNDFFIFLQHKDSRARAPFLVAQLGDAEEFVRVFRKQAPQVEYVDSR